MRATPIFETFGPRQKFALGPNWAGWACHLGRCLGLALAVGLAGCAGTRHAQQPQTLASQIVWPSPPEVPRIAFVLSMTQPSDFGARVSGWGRLANWITGAERGNERLVKPFGVAIDEKDNLGLTDTGANAVGYLDRARHTWKRWTTVGRLRFASPVALAVWQGIFYVADSGRGSLVVFNEKGQFQREITNHLARPSGVAVVGERLLVVDSQRHCVVEFNLAGRYVSEFGRRGTGPGEFNFPTHIAADRAGNVYVSDSMNGRIQVFDPTGRFRNQIGASGDTPGSFGRPKGVAVDSFGHVYVMDALFDNVQIFDGEGRLLLNIGETGSSPGQFWLPNGIAISGRDEIFVADSYNHRVQVFKYIGPP